jgi:hypothetical protein
MNNDANFFQTRFVGVTVVTQRSIIKFEPLYIPVGFQCNF